MSGGRRREDTSSRFGAFDTGRWSGVTAIAFGLGGAGILLRRPALLLVAVMAVAFAAHARAGTAPAPAVALERTVVADGPRPGDEVEVRIDVENVGDALLPDLRLVDGVPEGLEAVEPARTGTALRPGASTQFSYLVEASRGVHEFEPAVAASRDASGSAEYREEVAVEGDAALTCVPPLPTPVAPPLRHQTMDATGDILTRESGSGLAFETVREYRRGDPLSRIDWNRTAQTGELRTVEYQREQAASVVVLVDTRAEAYVAPSPGDPPAVERAVEAAAAVAAGLLDGGNRVGLATLSPDPVWLPPATGATHRARIRETLATHPGLGAVPPGGKFRAYTALVRLRRRLPPSAQVVYCAPLADDYGASVARRLDAHGHRVTVVSPDPGTDATVGGQVARIERSLRCMELRRANVPVVDWESGRLAPAVERLEHRWSA